MPVPPQTVRNNAARGLKLREEYGRGGTATGVARARDLKNGKDIPLATLKRMKAFFDRHQQSKDTPPKEGNGKIAWLLWGGDSGRSWAESQINQLEKKAKSFGVGDRVSWNSSGGRADGKITRVVRDGKLKVPGTSFTLTGDDENPAALIRLYRDGEPTDQVVGHRFGSLSPMSKMLQATEIMKVDDSLGLVFGFAIVSKIDGEAHFDRQADHIPEEVMLKGAFEFAKNQRVAKEMHRGDAIGSIVFMFPLTTEIAKSLDITTKRTGLLIAMKPEDPAVMEKFQDGTYTGFSIGGSAINEKLA